MTFTSLGYSLFLPAVCLVFHFTSDRWRWLILLASSYAFYASLNAPFLLVILAGVTGISYYCGLGIAATKEAPTENRWLWSGTCACLAVLIAVKYLPSLVSEIQVFGGGMPASESFVSLGVSYFTFQAISYLVDVYQGTTEAEKHLGYYALYLAFFPKLLQGPIERAADLLSQLKQRQTFSYQSARYGALLFTWGLFKKVVVADRLAVMVNSVYSNLHAYKGVSLVLATYYFALQIYFDFSGYSDMALGSAGLFGIQLTQNFRNPYFATSIADFWRRWHISFSRWILDYIFYPLQLSLRDLGRSSTVIALLVTFLVSGIWHGARWGFLVWGLVHGLYLSVSVLTKRFRKRFSGKHTGLSSKFWQIIQMWVTFNLVCIAWVFFRADSLSDAFYIFSHIITPDSYNLSPALISISTIDYAAFGLYWPEYLVLMGILFLAIIAEGTRPKVSLFEKPIYVRWTMYLTLSIITMTLYYCDRTGFIYAKF